MAHFDNIYFIYTPEFSRNHAISITYGLTERQWVSRERLGEAACRARDESDMAGEKQSIT